MSRQCPLVSYASCFLTYLSYIPCYRKKGDETISDIDCSFKLILVICSIVNHPFFTLFFLPHFHNYIHGLNAEVFFCLPDNRLSVRIRFFRCEPLFHSELILLLNVIIRKLIKDSRRVVNCVLREDLSRIARRNVCRKLGRTTDRYG